MSWWERIAPTGERPQRRGLRERLRSVYANRAGSGPSPVIVDLIDGRIIGRHVDGEFVPVRQCCADPSICEREECRSRLAELPIWEEW